MTIQQTRPADVLLLSGDEPRVAVSAAVYDTALGRSGGRRIEATSSARGNNLLVALYESPPYDFKVAPMNIARLSINLVGVPVFGAIASARGRHYNGRRYSIFYTPAGSDAHWSKPTSSRHLNIYFREDLLDELVDGREALLRRDRPLLDVCVREIKPWIDALELSIGELDPFADDASLGLAHLIVAKLTCLPQRRSPTLRPAVLSRVRDYVAEHLSETIRVADLAALTNLPIGRFALCFRASTGLSPRRFVLSQRLESAMRLLRDSPIPMVEVAAACGFSSQQHMATMMRRVAGVTPSLVRGQ